MKTGYAIAVQERSREKRRQHLEEETSWEIRKHSIWKQLWNLNLKHKIKHFIWKCLQNGIAVKEAIHKRTGIGDTICTVCGEGVETMEHMFFQCSIAKTVWKLAPVRWEGLRELQDNMWKWWEAVTQTRTKEQGLERTILTANILWQLWKARNKAVFDHQSGEAREIVQRAQQEWMEFDEATEQEKKRKQVGANLNQRARTIEQATEGVIRINTDAAINARMIRTGKGIIARHWTGKMLRAKGTVERKKGEALVEEILTIREALQLAKEAGWRKIEVQSDCKAATDQIRNINVREGTFCF